MNKKKAIIRIDKTPVTNDKIRDIPGILVEKPFKAADRLLLLAAQSVKPTMSVD